jgi:hypothetical protein
MTLQNSLFSATINVLSINFSGVFNYENCRVEVNRAGVQVNVSSTINPQARVKWAS